MSTILKALQKNKVGSSAGQPITLHDTPKMWKWKATILSSLFIIIALLITLLYLLLNPRIEKKYQPMGQIEVVNEIREKTATQVVFETQPLPIAAPPKKEIISKEIVPIKVVSTPEAYEYKNKQVIINKETQQPELEYGDASADLKKRFKLALLMNEIDHDVKEAEYAPAQGMNDGSDIHEMTSDFQDRVPLIRYDSHMYSSVVKDRWIRINGEILKEGDFDSSGQLELLEVQPQRSVFRLGKQSFSVESLSDWKGY